MPEQNEHITSSSAEKQLYSAYKTLNSRRRTTVLLWAVFILFAGFLSLLIAEHVLYLSSSIKTVAVLAVITSAATSVWKGLKSAPTQDFEEFYRRFSRKANIPELKDTLDLEKTGKGNQALIDAAILQNLNRLDSQRLKKVLKEYTNHSETNKNYKTAFLFASIVILTGLATAYNFQKATGRTLTFWESFEEPNPYLFAIEPADITLEQGSEFQASIWFQGNRVPDKISLQVKTSVEENFRTVGMNANEIGYASIPFELYDDLEYFIQMDEYKSKVYSVEVQLRPRFTTLQALVVPPSYTLLDSVRLNYPFSQVRAFEGSEIIFTGQINKEVSKLVLRTTTESDTLQINSGNAFSYNLQLTKSDTISFEMADQNGLTNKNPFQVLLSPQVDEYPVVEILEPEQSIEKVNPRQLNVLYRASDDFQLSGASFQYELQRAFVNKPEAGAIALPRPVNGSAKGFTWALDSLNLKPKDVLSFWVKVQDNDAYNGYKSSISQVLTLTIPSLVNYFEDLDEKESEIGSDLDEVSESFREMQEQYERFKEKMKENPDQIGYEQTQELEQVKRQQEEVQKKIDELNRKFNEIKKELDENSVLSEETRQAYEELQKLMKEIDDPAFLEALEKMREQLGQFSPEQLREAMENLEFNEELYKERLERTIELFKQLKLNSDLEKLVKSYEEMARREQELKESNPGEEQKKQQRQQSLEENEKLKQNIDSLSENATSKTKKSLEEYQKEAKQQLDELNELLKKELNQEENGELNQPRKSQQSPQQKYQQLAEMTKSLMQGMQQQQAQFNIAGLKYILYSLLTLSIEQEDLTTLASATESRSQAFITFAREQRNVEDIFATLSDSLYKLSAESPQFSNQINEKKLEVEKQLERALEQMAERNQNRSAIATRQALGGINEISFMLANLLEQLQNSQNGGGGGGMSVEQMMQQMQQSGEQQQKLNEMLQQMINDIQGERLSQDQMERLNDIAKTQNQIRKQLQELQQNGKAGDKIGSEIERMIEQMEETINDLRGGNVDPTMVERQQNILSRMLEAEKALEERDEEEKREGKTAEEFERSTPPELTLEELEKQIRKRLNDPDFTKYSNDYQRLIEKYFQLLQDLQKREL